MSRRLLSPHRLNPHPSDNPYQPTTTNRPAPYSHQQRPRYREPYRNGQHQVVDTVLSEDTFTDSQIYPNYYHENRYITSDRSFSDDSGSIRIPGHHEDDDDSYRRLSRNTYSSNRSYGRKERREKINQIVHQDVRKVYPQQYGLANGRVYQENPGSSRCEPELPVPQPVPPRVPTVSRLPDRPQSSVSSGVTSAIVDGCGGKCETFENICYFFLQLIFMMGILIGISLCIAGLVLRKSAARNLQVLVYIGALLAIVSAILLGIQWNARREIKKRQSTVRNAKRAPIPLETINPRAQPLIAVQEGHRVVPQVLRHHAPPPQPDEHRIPL